MRILLFLFIVFIFGCGEVPDADTEKPNGLFSAGDTITVTTTSEGVTARSISVTTVQDMVIIDEKKDTNIITLTPETKTFTYNYMRVDTVVKRYKGGVVVVPPVDPPPTTGTRSNIIFESLFNGSNPFPTSTLYKQACCSHSATQSKNISREGDGSFKAEVRGNDPQSSGGYRSEFIPPTNTRLIDGWYGYSVYMQDWKACSSCGEHIMQWHPDNGSGSAVLAIYTEKNTFHIRLNPEGDLTAVTIKDGMQIIPNKWYDWVWHVVWSSDKTKGRIEAWVDGVKYVDYTGATLTTSGTPYFKVGGINRWNLSGVTRIMYTDAVRIGNEKASFKDVAP